ncbi:transposase [Nonomuraea rubra]
MLLDAELYLPKSWTGDRARCVQAGIPAGVPFATKPALATAMLDRALDGAVPASWVSVDEAYGQDHKFRLHVEERTIGYVVAVPRNQSLGTGYGNTGSRADAVTADAPEQAWKRLSAGDGAYLCFGPAGTPLEQLVRIAGSRWPSRSASSPPRTKSVSTSTRSGATTAGTATSPWRCSPTPISPSPPRTPQKHVRPGPPHPSRDPQKAVMSAELSGGG